MTFVVVDNKLSMFVVVVELQEEAYRIKTRQAKIPVDMTARTTCDTKSYLVQFRW